MLNRIAIISPVWRAARSDVLAPPLRLSHRSEPRGDRGPPGPFPHDALSQQQVQPSLKSIVDGSAAGLCRDLPRDAETFYDAGVEGLEPCAHVQDRKRRRGSEPFHGESIRDAGSRRRAPVRAMNSLREQQPAPTARWTHEAEFAGVSFACIAQPSPSPRWEAVLAVKGVPEHHLDELLTAAQIANSGPEGPKWQVERIAHVSEITTEILRRARVRYESDVHGQHTQVVSFFGVRASGDRELLGSVGVRQRFSEAVVTRYWGIFGRVVILPQYRGSVVARHFVTWGAQAAVCAANEAAIGFFGETESVSMENMSWSAMEEGQIHLLPLDIERSTGHNFVGGPQRNFAWLLGGLKDLAERLRAEDPAASEFLRQTHVVLRFGAQAQDIQDLKAYSRDGTFARLRGHAVFADIALEFADAVGGWYAERAPLTERRGPEHDAEAAVTPL